MQRWRSGFRICKASSISSAGVFMTTLPSSHTPMGVYVVVVSVVVRVVVMVMVMIMTMMVIMLMMIRELNR